MKRFLLSIAELATIVAATAVIEAGIVLGPPFIGASQCWAAQHSYNCFAAWYALFWTVPIGLIASPFAFFATRRILHKTLFAKLWERAIGFDPHQSARTFDNSWESKRG